MAPRTSPARSIHAMFGLSGLFNLPRRITIWFYWF
jgi:hypothetical protein